MLIGLLSKVSKVETLQYLLTVYGNFDVVSDLSPRIFKLYATPHAPSSMLYLVPMVIGYWLVLTI